MPATQPASPGLYVHVPFCARRCDFCAFYERAPRRADIDHYLDGVVKELAGLRLPDKPQTVFWGGGTPGVLTAGDMERLAAATLDTCGQAPAEWTVEMTPGTMRKERLRVLKSAGVTRISMGVQSFDEEILHALGRTHTVEQVLRAVDAAREAGFDNLNLDMMFALPGQSFERWETDLRRAMELKPEHLSTYCLTFEEDTPLWLRLTKGGMTKRSEEEEARFYERTWAILEEAGFSQYEVSNFSRPGRECLHNLNTWRMGEWIGVGPSAASQFGMRRYANVASLERWLAGIESGTPALKDIMELDEETLAQDCLIFGLRMTKGVDLNGLTERFPSYDWDHVREWATSLSEEGLAQLDEKQILRLTPKGRLVADQVALALL